MMGEIDNEVRRGLGARDQHGKLDNIPGTQTRDMGITPMSRR